MSTDNSILQSYNGLIRFYDGTVIAIEDQEYSSDGQYNWEKTLNPSDHISTLDGVTSVLGHRYKRIKHSGDTNFQLPYRIIPEEPVFRIQSDILQYKLETESSTEWNDLLDTTTLQGEDGDTGEQGIPGEGWNIDSYGYYKLRPDCSSSLVSNCNSCNSSSSTNPAYTFMSLGDGVLVLTAALIAAGTVTVDAVPYSHFSNDLITWTALTGGIVDFKARYLATDDTGAVYTDMRTEDYYSTMGLVYVCSDGSWTILTNVATPSYMVGERTASSNIGFLDNFIDDTLTNFLSNTIGFTSDGKFEIAEQSIDETALIQTSVGDGLEILSAMAKPQVNASDFAGFGLSNYTSVADSLDNIQVAIDTLILDGLSSQNGVSVDGETHTQAFVNVSDLININSFLVAGANPTPDTFNDLFVNLGFGLIGDGDSPQAITIDVDDLSLMVDTDSLRVKPYAAGNDGVMRQHLNPDIIWDNKGVGLDIASGIYARIDGATIGYDGSGNLEIPLNGVTGDRLNDDTADNTKGIEILNDLLTVKVDGTTIDFDGSGQLSYIGAAGVYVASLTAGGTTVRDDVIYNVTTAGGGIDIGLTATINAGSDTIDLILDVNEAWLAAYLIANPPAGTAAAWGGITGTVTNQTDLVAYISGLDHVALNTWYNNAQITVASGVILKAITGETYRLTVDATGNLDTVLVP